jgi:hypothetical protein
MTPNESAAKHEWIPENVKLPHCCSCGWECNDFTCTERDCRVQWEAHVAAAQPLVAATEGPEGANVLKDAEAHLSELAEAWDCGALSEHDGLGGTRSNRNASLLVRLRAALAESQQQIVPPAQFCKARAGNVGANDPQDCDYPDCGCGQAAAPATEGKLSVCEAHYDCAECNEYAEAHDAKLRAQVRSEALEEAAKMIERITYRFKVLVGPGEILENAARKVRALAAQPSPAPKEKENGR